MDSSRMRTSRPVGNPPQGVPDHNVRSVPLAIRRNSILVGPKTNS